MTTLKKILVIDDEKDMVDAIKDFLEENNQFEVMTAYDGHQGLEKARKEGPDLVVLDLMLPKIDGHKVCALLKKDARFSGIPILILTAKAHHDDEKLAWESGADAYVTKPFEPQSLIIKIENLIHNRTETKFEK